MDLNLSNRGLFSFDAAKARESVLQSSQEQQHRLTQTHTSTNSSSASAAALASSSSQLPIIRQLNLSYNSLHLFTGGEALKGLTVLDLSHNALTRLHGQPLPCSLVKLNLSHNRLTYLGQLSTFLPCLQDLNLKANALNAAALRDLPVSLKQLNLEGNEMESLTPLQTLVHLAKLNLAHNRLEDGDVLESLRPLLSLRHLDLRGNVIAEGFSDLYSTSRNTSLGNATSTTTAAAAGLKEAPRLLRVLNDVLPRLAFLNGTALSQAPQNQMWRNTRRQQREQDAQHRAAEQRRSLSSSSHSRGGPSCRLHLNSSSDLSNGSQQPQQPALEVRLMQAKVKELRRLLLSAQDAEGKARQERALLIESVTSTANVIDRQEKELNRLQSDVARLQAEEQQLRVPVAVAEQSFEQIHASLLATKASANGKSNLK